ncbi:MAG: AMP-binding protein [Deltaproteobacteria bacterium]|nr:AMP-binding protein [Deltaproteobacteria bacterium]
MIHKSPYGDLDIPQQTLTRFVFQNAEKWGNKPAMIDGGGGRSYTYAEMVSSIEKTAAGLSARGFSRGDVMAVYSTNRPDYAVLLHAVASLGGALTTISSQYTADELANQITDSRACFLTTQGDLMETAQKAVGLCKIKEVFTFDGAPESVDFAELLNSEGSLPQIEVHPAQDIVVLPYSSGTTGLPKGVMLTHRNLVANMLQIRSVPEEYSVTENSTVVGVLPFFHIYGMVVIMNHALSLGATVVTLPRFEMGNFLETVEQHRVTTAYLVPPILLGLSKHPMVEQKDLSSLEIIVSGAAPLGESLARAVEKRLGCRVVQGYGLTETSPVTHLGISGEGKAPRASIGFLVAGTEAQLISPSDGGPVGPDCEGELIIKGPQVMKGYLNRPDSTSEVIDKEGWLHTGDLAVVDDQGYFYILDRLKELIKYKGYQVAPAELEGILVDHPDVADVAVIPSPDQECGEVPKAFVVLKNPESTVSEDDLMKFVEEKVASYKKIRRLEFIDSIPKSPSGKILRRLLVRRERITQMTDR